MAYTFNNIDNMLQGQQSGSNIFAQGQGQGQQDSGGSSGGQSAGSGTKTTTEGTLGSGGPSASSSQPQQQATPKVNTGQAILDRAKNTQQDTGFSSNLAQNVKGAQAKLEDEANAYTTNQRAKAQTSLDTADLDRAASGDQYNYQKVSNLLHGGASPKADEFNSGIASGFSDLDALKTRGGLQDYLQKRGGATYNAGQSALDSLLISKDKNYQSNLQDALQARGQLQSRQQELQSGGLRNQIQSFLDTSGQQAKGSAEGYLSKTEKDLANQLSARAQQYNLNRQQEQRIAQENLGSRRDKLVEQLKQQHPEMGTYINSAAQGVDPNKYYKAGEGAYNLQNVAEADEAGKYNRILDLLGKGGQGINAKSGLGDAYTFNEGGLMNDILNSARNLQVTNPTVGPGGTLYAPGGMNMGAISEMAARGAKARDDTKAGLQDIQHGDIMGGAANLGQGTANLADAGTAGIAGDIGKGLKKKFKR